MRQAQSNKKGNVSVEKNATAHVIHERPIPRSARVQALEARKRPRQDRSRAMVDAILQAAAELFAGCGYARTTTNRIAERAGVSVGSLYQYFPNKDSLLAAILKEHREEVHTVIDEGLRRLADPAVRLEEGLRALLRELLDVHLQRPAITRALSPEVLRESSAAPEHHKADDDAELVRQIAALLSTRSDVRDGVPMAMAAVLGQTTAHLTRWLVHEAPKEIPEEALLEETVQLLVRYLRVESDREANMAEK